MATVALSPPSLTLPWYEIMIASCVLRRPLAQRIPISTHTRLIDARISVPSRVKKCIIRHAHDMLSQGVKTMHIMFCMPPRLLAGSEGNVMLTYKFLYQETNLLSVSLLT